MNLKICTTPHNYTTPFSDTHSIMARQEWWTWPGQASPLLSGLLLYPMLIFLVLKLLPPGQARRRLFGQKQKNKKQKNLRKIWKKKAIMSKKSCMARTIEIKSLRESIELQIKEETPKLPKLPQSESYGNWPKHITGLIGSAPKKPSKESYNKGEKRKEDIEPQIKKDYPKLPILPRKSHGNWPKPITGLYGGAPPKPKPKESGFLRGSPMEETLSRGHKLLLEMDTNFICSPRLIVTGDYENDGYKLSVKRRNEGQLIEYNLISPKAKTKPIIIKAKMLYRYSLTPDNKVYGYSHEEGWTWPGYGYCHSSSALLKYAEIRESLYYKGFKPSHYLGPDCQTQELGSWAECNEPTCGIRIWSVDIKTYLTDLKDNCTLRRENQEDSISISLVVTNGGEKFLFLQTEKDVVQLKKVKTRTVESPDINKYMLVDAMKVYNMSFTKETEEQGQTAIKIYRPNEFPLTSIPFLNKDSAFAALNIAVNMLYLNPACNFGHLVKLAKTILTKENDYLVHYLDHIFNSDTVKKLNEPKEGSMNLSSTHACIYNILKTLEKSLSELHNKTMNTFMKNTFNVCLDNIYDRCSLCKKVPDAFKIKSWIPDINLPSEKLIDLNQSTAIWLEWLKEKYCRIELPLLTCNCTPKGNEVTGSRKINKIPNQLFVSFKKPCSVKNVHTKITILNETFIVKAIVQQTPLNETMLSVRTSTGWVKVLKDASIAKYCPSEI